MVYVWLVVAHLRAAARTVFGVHILDSLTRQKFKHSSNDCPNAAVAGANMKGELVHSCRERQRLRESAGTKIKSDSGERKDGTVT